MSEPGRKYNAGSGYRYGFNGKENDNKDGVVQYDYGFRIYDQRLSRFKSVDPLLTAYPYYTPYQFAGNMPIAAIDLDGLEQFVVIYYKDQNGNTISVQIRTVTDNAGNLQDQKIHKVANTTKVAKGNVLVFESYQDKSRGENLKIVDSRNKKGSALTTAELEVYKKHKEQEKEQGEIQSLDYGGPPTQYESEDFINSATKTFSSEKEVIKPSPVTFEGQVLSPNKKFSFEAIPVYGDQSIPMASSVKTAGELGKALKNTGVTTLIIQPKLYDPTGGEGANTKQANGKTFIQNEFEQYQKFGEIIKKASGGKVNVQVNYPQISRTSLEGQKLDIQTK
jgi:RHS repeat-associated protein